MYPPHSLRMRVDIVFHDERADAFARTAACRDAERKHDMPRA